MKPVDVARRQPIASRKRILFFAEAVTLAHVARPIALARQLDPARFEVTVACDTRYARFLAPEAFCSEPLAGIGSQEFIRRLSRGSPVYTTNELRGYVRDDLALIERTQPDLIVGDFRLSLSVSARLAKRPYAAVTNAYWSPFALEQRMPLPVLPISRYFPLSVAGALFALAQPIAMRAHCAALNKVRIENGLPSLGHDLRRVYTDADFVLYADPPGLFEMNRLPSDHHVVGALDWSPPVVMPEHWDDLPLDKPTVYLALGSSGDPRVLRMAMDALSALPVNLIVSAAGANLGPSRSANVITSDYIDGGEAAKRSCVVVCNGGSMGCQQAIAAGVPMVGIASNMDQFLNMAAIVKAGAGKLLRADRVEASQVRAAVAVAMNDEDMRRAAEHLCRASVAGQTMSFDAFASRVSGCRARGATS